MAADPADKPKEAPAGKPDYKRAAALYRDAEFAMQQLRYDAAATSYQGAYDITRDPVLFFKLASAHDKAGRCDVALPFYRHYLNEGHPNAEFTTLTQDRIKACEAMLSATTTPEKPPEKPIVTPPPTLPEKPVVIAPKPLIFNPPPIDTRPPEARFEPVPSVDYHGPVGNKVAWTSALVGVGIAALGGIMLMRARATEDDINDLYAVNNGGRPIAFNTATQARFNDLDAQGVNDQNYATLSFALAGAAALTAIVIWAWPSGAESTVSKTAGLQIVPTVSSNGGGVLGSFSF